MTGEKLFDVIIIGGSYAGLSAAMTLGRSLRKTLVIDSGEPCNRQTPHSHNFLTQDGNTPEYISSLGRQQVAQYDSVTFFSGLATNGIKTKDVFAITTQSGDTFRSKKLILASGIKDMMPEIPGFASCWGITVIHCPYCHGYEYRGQKTGIFANGDRAAHLAGLVNNLTRKLTILTNGKAEFDAQQTGNFNRHDISVIETEIAEIEHDGGKLKAVKLKDGSSRNFDALYAAIPFKQSSDVAELLGCELTPQGHIKIDPLQKTSIPGVLACGDNSSPMRSVANAVATGSFAGAIANMELVQESF